MSADPSLRSTLSALRPMLAGAGLAPYVASFVVIAVLDFVAVGLLPVFVAALNEPQALLARFGLQNQVERLGEQQFIILLGVALAGFFVLKNLLFAALFYFQATFVAERQAVLSTRLLSVYLHRPYTFHLHRNSAELIAMTTGVAFNVFACVVVPGSVVLTEALVVSLVAALLLAVSPLATLLALLIVGGISLAFYWTYRTRLVRLGERKQAERNEMSKWATQTLAGIKETIILGRERFFVDRYARHAAAYSRPDTISRTIGAMPHLFIETIVVCGLVVVVIALAHSGASISAAFPTLALFGVAAIRLMPSVGRIVGALTIIKFYQPTVDSIAREMAVDKDELRQAGEAQGDRIPLEKEIRTRDLSYTYAGAASPALCNVSLRIERGWMVAFVGRSGAGKSTLVDILIGLHPPAGGAVLVDGRDIAVNVGAWQRSIGYVPQSIFLSDDTLRRNVAFGLEDAEIDDAGVLRALEAAQLGEFVRSLPGGLETLVGERGSRISGGQRQRIGIARALYRDPEVLVLDEPTTALDVQTAQEVAAVLVSLAGRKTILLIAHQMSSVKLCQRIFLLRDGAIAAEGTYDELAAAHPEFHSLVE